MGYSIMGPGTPDQIKNLLSASGEKEFPILKTSTFMFNKRSGDEITVWSPDGREIGTFWMSYFGGNCGICVAHNTQINGLYKGKGLGTEILRLQKLIGKLMGYTLMLCSYVDMDEHDGGKTRHVVEKVGYKDLISFENARTKHQIQLCAIHL